MVKNYGGCPSEEIHGFYVHDLSRDADGAARDEVIGGLQFVGGCVVDAQPATFGDVFLVEARKTLQAGDVAIVGRNDGGRVPRFGGVEDRQAAADFAARTIDIADLGAVMGADKELAVQAHVDVVMVPIGDSDGARHLHGAKVDDIKTAASPSRGLARTCVVGRWCAGDVERGPI